MRWSSGLTLAFLLGNAVAQPPPAGPADQSQQRQQYAREHPPRSSTGLAPLTELGSAGDKGERGGLYPNGLNTPPPGRLRAGIAIAHKIRPLDRSGRPATDGRIVMVSIGMSNTTQESQAFLGLLGHSNDVNPRFLFVDCAQGGQVARITARADANYWRVAEERLASAGATPARVQVAWIKQANPMPTAVFPEEARRLESDLAATVRNLGRKYSNLKIAYLSSRVYAGFAEVPLNPEPHAYESGFAVKWLIARQIAGDPELNSESEKGPAAAPWLSWGPYLWADGVQPRSDGLVWLRTDFGPDGTHPSPAGREKVAGQLLDFLRNDPTSRPWFLAR